MERISDDPLYKVENFNEVSLPLRSRGTPSANQHLVVFRLKFGEDLLDVSPKRGGWVGLTDTTGKTIYKNKI